MQLSLTIGIEKTPSSQYHRMICRFTVPFFFKSSFNLSEIQNIFNELSKAISESKKSLEKYGFHDSHFVMNPNKRDPSDHDVWHDGDDLIFFSDRLCSDDEIKKAKDFFKKYPTATHLPILGKTVSEFDESKSSSPTQE